MRPSREKGEVKRAYRQPWLTVMHCLSLEWLPNCELAKFSSLVSRISLNLGKNSAPQDTNFQQINHDALGR